jgi:hypothetical protein
VDFSLLLPGGVGVGILGWIGWLAHKAWLRQLVIGAASRGSGIIYEYLAARSDGLDPQVARQRAFAEAMAYMRQSVGGAIRSLGVTGETVENMVRGELGKLLSSDPTVTIVAKLPSEPTVPAKPNLVSVPPA